MNWSTSYNKLLCLLAFICFFESKAQNTFQDHKAAYPDYNELILQDNQSYDFSIENKKLKIIQDNHFESIILSENGIQNTHESFSYSELVPLKSYEAFSVVNQKGKEKKIKVTQSNEKMSNGSVFHDDVKVRQLIFPNLETGAKKVYKYQTEFIDPFLLHKFVFGNSIPIKNATLEITTPKDMTIGYRIFNDPNNTIVFTKTEKKGKWVYQWTLTDILPVKNESNAPGFLYIIPHIDFYIKDYMMGDKKIQVLGDTQQLYNYYKNFVKALNKTEDAELKAIALKVTDGSTTDLEKIKKIFYWVKDNIKYIAFENGYEGFIPREASLVCERKFGDCKDMSSIITSMAQYANVTGVSLCWIGTRNIPYSYAELSTPAVDDHMIAAFKNGNDYIFLDATDKQTRFGLPTAFIQGKEALLNTGEHFKILPVPVVTAEENEITETLQLSIHNDKLLGKGEMKSHGYNRSHILMAIGDAVNKARFEMIKSLVLKGNNKFNLKTYNETNIDDRDLPYIIQYDFDLSNYIIKVEKEMYINLFLNKVFDKMTIEKDRVSKFSFDYLTAVNSRYELAIPENHSIKYLPKNFEIDNALLKAEGQYEKKGNSLILHFKIKQKKLLLDHSDFAQWNETIQTLKNNYNESVILSQK